MTLRTLWTVIRAGILKTDISGKPSWIEVVNTHVLEKVIN